MMLDDVLVDAAKKECAQSRVSLTRLSLRFSPLSADRLPERSQTERQAGQEPRCGAAGGFDAGEAEGAGWGAGSKAGRGADTAGDEQPAEPGRGVN